jgi:hypothetical protein
MQPTYPWNSQSGRLRCEELATRLLRPILRPATASRGRSATPAATATYKACCQQQGLSGRLWSEDLTTLLLLRPILRPAAVATPSATPTTPEPSPMLLLLLPCPVITMPNTTAAAAAC